MQRDNRITAAIRPTVEDMGFQLVRAQMTGTVRPILQIMAEPSSGGAMTVQNCADLSRALSAVLDVEDPVGGAYTLEVSSPGVDRPLTRPQDFETYAGFDARVELDQAIDGQRRLKGKLCGIDEDGHVVI
ncbi:MAG: ribosome maturation factor RimP, partial [Alphaproteobacteria bacterium]